MKKIKKFWKKLDYWQRGGIMGFVVPILYFIIISFLDFILVIFIKNDTFLRSLQSISYFPLTIFSWLFDSLIFKDIDCMSEICALGGYHLLLTFFSPILYAILGGVIGLIVSTMKKQ